MVQAVAICIFHISLHRDGAPRKILVTGSIPNSGNLLRVYHQTNGICIFQAEDRADMEDLIFMFLTDCQTDFGANRKILVPTSTLPATKQLHLFMPIIKHFISLRMAFRVMVVTIFS